MDKIEHRAKFLCTTVGVFATVTSLLIAPKLFVDPINLPKALILELGVMFALLLLLFRPLPKVQGHRNVVLVVALLHFIIYAVLVLNDYSRETQILGAWGRSTGSLTWSSLFLLFYVVFNVPVKYSMKLVSTWFIRCAYVVYAYVLVQMAQVDPISWSSRQPTSFLGNINFVSAFLSFAAIVSLWKSLDRSTLISTRLFYISVALVFAGYSWTTGSLQGLVYFSVGSIPLFFSLVALRFRFQIALLFLTISTISYGSLIFGSFGLGPLGGLLRQETAIFRMDYWEAGISMIKSFPLGIGLDNYGSFYREFRSQVAATRTGPERVTNTAHNIFIDFGVGTGVFGLFLLLATTMVILAWGYIKLGKLLKLTKIQKEELVFVDSYSLLLGLSTAYFLFMAISINQIGVSVWGVVFFAVLYRMIQEDNINSIRKAKERHRELKSEFKFCTKLNSVLLIFLSAPLIALLFLVQLPYAIEETKFYRIYDSRDTGRIRVALFDMSKLRVELREIGIKEIANSADLLTARDLATALLKIDGRNFFANSLLMESSRFSDERDFYGKKLMKLDPHNVVLAEWLAQNSQLESEATSLPKNP